MGGLRSIYKSTRIFRKMSIWVSFPKIFSDQAGRSSYNENFLIIMMNFVSRIIIIVKGSIQSKYFSGLSNRFLSKINLINLALDYSFAFMYLYLDSIIQYYT